VTAFDELDRRGASTQALVARTKPKTLFRRMLLASEEVVRRGQESTSETQGLVRYAGVVWNAQMDDKEMEVFLRTLRSAYLPEPRKEKFEADLVFSDASQKAVHQVVSVSFLKQLMAKQAAEKISWNTDPFFIVHPCGTRHSFSKESIYSHLIVSKQTMDYVLALFLGLTLALHVALYSRQTEEDVFWIAAAEDTFTVWAYMWVASNFAVLGLKHWRTMDFGIQRQASAKIRAVFVGVPGFVADVCMWSVFALWCAGVVALLGVDSFTAVASSMLLWSACAGAASVVKLPWWISIFFGAGFAVMRLAK
jgi:hypothetical protein